MDNNLSRTEEILSCIIRAIKDGDSLRLDEFLFEFIEIHRDLLIIYKNQIINAIDIDTFYEKNRLWPILIEKYRVISLKDAIALKNQILERLTFVVIYTREDRESHKVKIECQIGDNTFAEIFYFCSNFTKEELENEKEFRSSNFKSMILAGLECSIRKRRNQLSDNIIGICARRAVPEYGFKKGMKLAYETKMLREKGFVEENRIPLEIVEKPEIIKYGSGYMANFMEARMFFPDISEAAKKYSEFQHIYDKEFYHDYAECIYGHDNRLHDWFLDVLKTEEDEHFANLKQRLDKEEIAIDPDTKRNKNG